MEIPDNIYTLIAKKLDGEASQQEILSLESWLKEDNSNRETLQQLEEIHNATGKYLQQPVDTAQAWRNIEARISTPQSTIPFRRPLMRVFAIAATFVIVVLAAWFGKSLLFPDSWEKVAALKSNIEQTLPDGSVVSIRKGSVMEWKSDFAGDRQVKLSGEAYFNVKHDENDKFTVTTGQSVTTVLGTAFMVRSQDGFDQVIVTRGKVNVASVSSNKPTAILLPGDKLLLSKDKLMRSSVSDSNFLAWKTGLLSFKETSLERVLKAMSDLYQVPISAKPANYSDNLLVTVSFDNEPLDKALDEIALITGLQVIKQANGSYLYMKK